MKRKDDPEDLPVDELRTEDMRLCALHHKWLKELFVSVRGNGDPKHGLEWKVQVLLDRQNVVVKLLWIVAGAVIINLLRITGMGIMNVFHHLYP